MGRLRASIERKLMLSFIRGKTRKQRRQRKHILIALGVGAILVLLVYFVQPFATINRWFTDQLFLNTKPSPDIVIVAVDDKSLQEYGGWPWPDRSLHASAVNNLKAAGAAAIGFDVLFADEYQNATAFAEAIKNAGNVVLAGIGDNPQITEQPLVVYKDFSLPAPVFAEAAAGIAHANVVPEGGSVVRKIPLVVSDQSGKSYPALVVSMYKVYLEQHVQPGLNIHEDYTIHNGSIRIFNLEIPVDGKSQMRVNFVGGPNTFKRLSYADVIQGNFNPADIKDKLVLVGMTASGWTDFWVTPVSTEKMFGVEIHANALDTILKGSFLQETSKLIAALTVLFMVVVMGFVLSLTRLRWGTVLAVVLFVGYGLGVFFAFDSGYILNIFYPLISLPIMYVTTVISRVFAAQADQSEITQLFGRYVSPQVASEILSLADADRLRLGGSRRDVTVMFADMRGFTALSEKLSPEEIVATLNKYLSLIIERVLANEGMINKFAGDNVMAVWNAPQNQPGHALLAVKAALEGQQAIIDNMPQDDSLPKVQFGIGINTGPAVAGNVGSEGRTEYTIIGDTVNLASRLCSNAPGGQIWIGPNIYEQVKGAVEVEALEPQHFKGKAEPVPVYRALKLRQQGD
jgi:adenylate cyclase